MRKFLLLFILSLALQAQERIVALSPAINEIIFALDAGDSIIANTDHARYPEEAKKLPKVGGYFAPNLEKIILLQPTLVVMQKNNIQMAKKLNILGIKTKVIHIDSLSSIKKAILELGLLLDKETKAKSIVKEINHELNTLKNITNNKKILIVFGRNVDLSKNVFVAGQNLYYDEIINSSGNTNALQSSRKGQPILNMENIIATNPDMVLLLARCEGDGISDEALIKPWLELPISAAKTKTIYINPHIYAGIPSDRLILFLQDFRTMLEAYKDKTQSPITNENNASNSSLQQ